MSQRWRVSQFLLGIEGLALLRRWVTGDPRDIGERVREIEDLCRRYRDAPAEDVIEVREVDAPTGYSSFAATYDHVENSLLLSEDGPVRLLLDELETGRVVDAACGTGRHTEYLVGRGNWTTAVDVSAAMLREARVKVPAANFIQGDLEALPVASNSHDVAVCSLALSHLAELRVAVGELARLVRPGGDVILSDIHPLAAVTGAHVAVRTGEGTFILVRNNFHPYSRYLEAFMEHGLEVAACREVAFDAGRYGSGGALDGIPEATAMALDGLPFVLIWHLKA